ncbi:MAG: membrane protein insertase YidC [Chitinophagales bacterium]|nr:membrane protein insertase YidC [Chitinophagales bacterium]
MFKNKETVIGWVLLSALMFIFFMYTNKKEMERRQQEQAKQEQAARDSLQKKPAPQTVTSTGVTADTLQATTNTDSLLSVAQYGPFAEAASGKEDTVVVENELQRIVFTNKGGQIKSIELKKYKTWDKKPLILFTNQTNTISYQFPVGNDKVINTADMYFEVQGAPFSVKGAEKKSITFRLNAGNGRYFEQKYTLRGNEYLIDYEINTVGLSSVLPQNTTFINAEWTNTLAALEQNVELERRYSSLYYRYHQKQVEHFDEDAEKGDMTFDVPLEWISFKQQFFNATLFSDGAFARGRLQAYFDKNDKSYVKKYKAGFTLNYQPTRDNQYRFQWFIGPNHFNTLNALDREAEEIVKLGPNFWMFSWIKYITRFIIWVFSWFESIHLNYGIIILLMTLLLKLVLHPLTSKSIESSAKMKILAPEINALREKYGDDQQKISQETMKLYSRAGVNPLGGCLPLLLQMPILMAMYYFFPASIELRQQPFLWAHDLSSFDAIVSWSKPVLGFTHISLFTILMTITSIVQAVMNNSLNPVANQQPGMKYLPYVMPLMLMFIFNSFPAALTYYYLLQNLLGVAHQWIIQKFFIDEVKLRKQIEENKKNPPKKSGWMAKLEEMQRENERRMRAARK